MLVETAPLAETTTLAEIQAKEHRRLRKAMDALADDSPDEALHDARIQVKRARYAAELSRDGRYVTAAKALQDVLGEHQDAVVAAARLRELAEKYFSAEDVSEIEKTFTRPPPR